MGSTKINNPDHMTLCKLVAVKKQCLLFIEECAATIFKRQNIQLCQSVRQESFI